MEPIKFGLGQALTRKEDEALLRGAGRYVADHAPAGLLHAVVLRSPHAHARLRITDVAKARAVDWEPLPPVIGAAAALEQDAPLIWPATRSNLAFECTLGDAKATARGF